MQSTSTVSQNLSQMTSFCQRPCPPSKLRCNNGGNCVDKVSSSSSRDSWQASVRPSIHSSNLSHTSSIQFEAWRQVNVLSQPDVNDNVLCMSCWRRAWFDRIVLVIALAAAAAGTGTNRWRLMTSTSEQLALRFEIVLLEVIGD